MKILCGLGNPGKKYENTRHNAGFLFVDFFARLHLFPPFKEKWGALVSEKGKKNKKLLLVKPLSYMNLSGGPISELLHFYHLPHSDLTVVYDDVDLKLGTIRYRREGSAGTHNGMKSLIETLGSSHFPRLRLGIESRGETAPTEMNLEAFVLFPFSESERLLFDQAMTEGAKMLENLLPRAA